MPDPPNSPSPLSEEMITHYEGGQEAERLSTGAGRLEADPTILGISAHLMAIGRK